jgi:hypothetical protein
LPTSSTPKRNDMPKRGGKVPLQTHEQDQSGSSVAPSMRRMLLLPPNAAHLHRPQVSLTGSTSKSEAPKREHDTIAPPSPIQRNKSGVSPRGCWEGTWRILHWRLQQGHDARRRHRQQLWHSQSAAFAGILTPKPGKPVSVISQNFPNFGMLK